MNHANKKFFTHQPILEFKCGVRDMLPLSLAVIPWAVMAGALAMSAGLGIAQSIAMSVFIFAGAAQIMSLSMLMAGASTVSILVTIFFMTTQHFIYALSLRKSIYKMAVLKRMSLGFLLTDELYAVSELYPHRSYAYLFGAGLSFYIFWVAFSIFGVFCTFFLKNVSSIPLDYSIVAIFLVMALLLIKNVYGAIAVIVSGCFATLFKWMELKSGIIFASLLNWYECGCFS